MNLVKVRIEKDDNTVRYIKMIREFDNSISIGEIKKRIDSNDVVLEYDLDNSNWIHMENMTEYKWHRIFYKFLQGLERCGASINLTLVYEVSGFGQKSEPLSMKELDRLIRFNKEIWDEVENKPD